MSETGIYIRVGKDNILLEDLDEIERTLWLQSLSENGLIRTVNRCCDVIEDFIVNYQHLEQENQQLKEQIELNDFKTTYNQFVNYKNWYFEYVDKCEKYKSVLDEIREYINKNKYFYSGLQHEDLEIGLFEDEINDLLQMLDKVKDENK